MQAAPASEDETIRCTSVESTASFDAENTDLLDADSKSDDEDEDEICSNAEKFFDLSNTPVDSPRSLASLQSYLATMNRDATTGADVRRTPRQMTPLPNGKKTKGRVKIKMEFISDKMRRYTTFSKRKTGIMKKAYELSTLTGTQVMLLVASETGHVYTFATKKLQPIITSQAGKKLIQNCLNAPDEGGSPEFSEIPSPSTALTDFAPGMKRPKCSPATQTDNGSNRLAFAPGDTASEMASTSIDRLFRRNGAFSVAKRARTSSSTTKYTTYTDDNVNSLPSMVHSTPASAVNNVMQQVVHNANGFGVVNGCIGRSHNNSVVERSQLLNESIGKELLNSSRDINSNQLLSSLTATTSSSAFVRAHLRATALADHLKQSARAQSPSVERSASKSSSSTTTSMTTGDSNRHVSVTPPSDATPQAGDISTSASHVHNASFPSSVLFGGSHAHHPLQMLANTLAAQQHLASLSASPGGLMCLNSFFNNMTGASSQPQMDLKTLLLTFQQHQLNIAQGVQHSPLDTSSSSYFNRASSICPSALKIESETV